MPVGSERRHACSSKLLTSFVVDDSYRRVAANLSPATSAPKIEEKLRSGAAFIIVIGADGETVSHLFVAPTNLPLEGQRGLFAAEAIRRGHVVTHYTGLRKSKNDEKVSFTVFRATLESMKLKGTFW